MILLKYSIINVELIERKNVKHDDETLRHKFIVNYKKKKVKKIYQLKKNNSMKKVRRRR